MVTETSLGGGPPPGAVYTASGGWRAPPAFAVGGVVKNLLHFASYGANITACGEENLPIVFVTDRRANTTCVDCLQFMLKKTEERVENDIAKHLEKSLSVPAIEGWREQIAQGLIRSFETGELYVIDNLEKELLQLLVDWDSSEGFKDDVMDVINHNRKKRATP